VIDPLRDFSEACREEFQNLEPFYIVGRLYPTLNPAKVANCCRTANCAAAESGMWKRKGTRTNSAEVERLLRTHALILAEIDGVLVGSVNVNLMSDGVESSACSWLTFTTAEKGIGSALVDRAENWARDMACHTMRLELLTPRNWTHPSKEFLRKWYSRSGYKPQATESFEILHPELVPELATECDFTVWHKSLA